MRTEDLKKFNQAAKKVVDKKGSVVQFQHVLFKDGYIIASNTYTTIKQRIQGLEGVETFSIEFTQFDKLITKLKNSEIDFKKEGEGKVKIVTEKGNFTFSSLNEQLLEDFPYYELKVSEKYDVIGKEDVKLIKKAVNYTAKDELRPVMNTVFVNENHIVGSDYHYLSFYPSNGDREGKEYMIPKQIVPLIPESEVIEVKKGSKLFKFVCNDGFSITFKEVEGNYLKYTNVIPSDNPNSFTISEKDLKEALDLSQLSMNGVGLIVFESSDAGLTIKAADLDKGTEYSNTFETKIGGDYMRIGFKHKLLTNLVKTENAKEYKFKMSEPSRGAIINNEVLLMPMMIEN